MEVKRQYTQTAQNHAKNLRQNQPDAEHLLWHHLRHKQLAGYKFRRQQPIGKYIVDFVCMPEKLIIELDGSQHAEQQNYDRQRDAFLKEEGYRVLRYWNNSLLSDCFAVLEDIFNHLVGVPATVPPPHQCEANASTSATPPQGGSDRSIEHANMALHNHQPSNHSPLEGESASQEQSSQASRWGDGHSPQINSWMKVKRQYTQTAQTHAKNLRQKLSDCFAVLEDIFNHLVGVPATVPPPHQCEANASTSATPPQGGSDRSIERAKMALHNHQPSNHSPLEGESASQEQRSQASRWGDEHSPRINSWMEVKRQYTQTAQTHAKNLRQKLSDCFAVLEDIFNHLVGVPATVPPPHQCEANASTSATPPQGGSNRSIERAKMALHNHQPSNHSPLEGESASQEQRSQASRWGDEHSP